MSSESGKGGDCFVSDIMHYCRDFDRLGDWLRLRYEQSSVKWDD